MENPEAFRSSSPPPSAGTLNRSGSLHSIHETAQQEQQLPIRHKIGRVKAIILVGGTSQGTTFRPLSLKTPAPLFPIGGVPHVLHSIRAAAKLPQMTEVLLVGSYPEHEFAHVVREAKRETGIPVRYLQEYTSLGTAGGIYHFRDVINTGNPDALFVLHSNLCCDYPLKDMMEFHATVGCGQHATLLSVKARRDLIDLYGVVAANEQTHQVLHYVEKPSSFVSDNVNCGVYLLSPSVLESIRKVFLERSEGSRRKAIFFELDIIPRLANEGNLYLFQSRVFWSQIKTASAAVYANSHYLARARVDGSLALATNQPNGPKIVGDVYIHPTAVVACTAKLGPNVSIGPGVRIEDGVRVRDSILLDNVELDAQSCVLNSVVGWGSYVGKWARIEGVPVVINPNDPSTHIPQKPLFNGEGKLEPNITILGEEVIVQDELVVLHSLVLPHKTLSRDHKNEIIL